MPRSFCFLSAVAALVLAGPLLPQDAIVAPSSRSPMLAPSSDRDGHTVAICSSVEPDGTRDNAWDVWLWSAATDAAPRRLTNYADSNAPYGVTYLDLSPDGSKVAYIVSPTGSVGEGIHVIDIASGADQRLTTDNGSCVVPAAALCEGCFYSCVQQARLTPQGGVLYAAARSQPLYVVSPDGSTTELPVYSANLAFGPQRVISDSGVVVFTSAAIASESLAATTTDVYLMNLDGSNIRNVTHFPVLNPNITVQNATISADGSTVAFEAYYDLVAGPLLYYSNIFEVNADGSNLRQITSGPDSASGATLSADGSWIAWLLDGQIYELPSGASNPAPLTAYHYSTVRDARISDDGSLVSYAIGPPYGGIGAIDQIAAGGGTPDPVYAPVSLNPTGVIGIVGWVPPSPGSLFSVYGLNFNNDELEAASSFPLPTSLGNVSLRMNGQPMPLSSITPWQINAQLPQSLPAGNVTIQVRFGDRTGVAFSNTVSAEVQPTGPAVFDFTWQGYDQAAAFHAGTRILADAEHPLSAGEVIETYGTGLGVTTPVVIAGEPSPLAYAQITPPVTLGSLPVKVTFAGLVPGLAGIYQVNLQVPQGLAAGPQSLSWAPGAQAVLFVQ